MKVINMGIGIFSVICATLLIITLVLQRGTEITLLLTLFFGLYAGVLYGNRKVINSKKLFHLIIVCHFNTYLFCKLC